MIVRVAVAVAALVLAGWGLAPLARPLLGLLAQAGGPALAAMVGAHVVPVALCGAAWALVMPGVGTARMVVLRWLRDGVNEMLAVVPLAGEAAALRLLGRLGVKPARAVAGMVADLSAEVVAQVLFSLAGLALWAGQTGGGAVLRWGVPGALAATGVAVAFVAVQHGGHLLPGRRAAAGLHRRLMALYRQPRRLSAAVALHGLAWFAACAEAWVGLRLLGHPVDVAEAVMLESAVFALRSVAFAIPGALGVQEGGYALLAPLLGVAPETALALSLLKRGREAVLGVPALAVWLRLAR